MKMKNFSFYALLAGALCFTASCDKDVENTSLKVDLARTIPVKGYAYANTNDTKAGLENAPVGTILVLSVNYADLGTTSVGKWIDTVTTDANGQFSANVPVDDNGVTLNVDPQPFEANQTYYDGSSLTAQKKLIFSAATIPFSVTTSINKILQVDYSTSGYDSNVSIANYTLKLLAPYDLTSAGDEPAAAIDVYLYADGGGWAEKHTTDSNGDVTFSAPADKAIKIKVDAFIHVQKNAAGNNENKTYYINNGTAGATVTLDVK